MIDGAVFLLKRHSSKVKIVFSSKVKVACMKVEGCPGVLINMNVQINEKEDAIIA